MKPDAVVCALFPVLVRAAVKKLPGGALLGEDFLCVREKIARASRGVPSGEESSLDMGRLEKSESGVGWETARECGADRSYRLHEAK